MSSYKYYTVYVLLLSVKINDLQVDWDTYGVDWDGPVPTDDDVTIEELEYMLDESQKDQLQALLSPLANRDLSKQGI